MSAWNQDRKVDAGGGFCCFLSCFQGRKHLSLPSVFWTGTPEAGVKLHCPLWGPFCLISLPGLNGGDGEDGNAGEGAAAHTSVGFEQQPGHGGGQEAASPARWLCRHLLQALRLESAPSQQEVLLQEAPPARYDSSPWIQRSHLCVSVSPSGMAFANGSFWVRLMSSSWLLQCALPRTFRRSSQGTRGCQR